MNPDTSPTPRTDEQIWTTFHHHENCDVVDMVFARLLERELAEKTNEVARLRELLNRAIGCTKNALFFARTYDNKNQWNEIDKLWDEVRELEKAALAPAPEETHEGVTMDEWYNGFSKIESTEPANPTCSNTTHKFSHCDCKEPAPDWRELGQDEVIGADDEYNPASLGDWIKVPHGWIGEKCDITRIRTRRPLPVQEEPYHWPDFCTCEKCNPEQEEKAPDDLHAWMRLQEDINREVATELQSVRDEIQKLKEAPPHANR